MSAECHVITDNERVSIRCLCGNGPKLLHFGSDSSLCRIKKNEAIRAFYDPQLQRSCSARRRNWKRRLARSNDTHPSLPSAASPEILSHRQTIFLELKLATDLLRMAGLSDPFVDLAFKYASILRSEDYRSASWIMLTKDDHRS